METTLGATDSGLAASEFASEGLRSLGASLGPLGDSLVCIFLTMACTTGKSRTVSASGRPPGLRLSILFKISCNAFEYVEGNSGVGAFVILTMRLFKSWPSKGTRSAHISWRMQPIAQMSEPQE